MLLILIATIALGLISAFLVIVGDDRQSAITFVVGFLGVIVSVVALVSWLVMVAGWFSSGYKADIINREFGTNYTQAEVFWAEDVLNEVRELKRQRIELNGNLLSKEK